MGNFFSGKSTTTGSNRNIYDPASFGLFQQGTKQYGDFLSQMAGLTGVDPSQGTSIASPLQQALHLSGAEMALPTAFSKAFSFLPETMSSIGSTISTAMQGLDTDAVLNPLIRAFQQQIMPEIRSSAVRAGAGGGSRELELANRAYGEFGGQAADALARQEIARRQTEISAQQALPQVLMRMGGLGFTPAAMEADIGAQQRAMEMQRIGLPMQLLSQYGGYTPMAPLQIGGDVAQTTRTQESPYKIMTGVINDMMQFGNYLGTGGGFLGGPTTPFSSSSSGTPNQGIPQSGWGGSIMNSALLMALLGGGGGAGAGAMMSDRRLKSNIQRIGTHPLGIGWYGYDIYGMHMQGVMADEVVKVRPDAVSLSNGYFRVDYDALSH